MRWRSAILVVTTLAVLACGTGEPPPASSGDAPDGGARSAPDAGVSPGPTAAEFQAAIHRADCIAEGCGLGYAPSLALRSCFMRTDPDYAAAVTSGRARLDPELGRACLDAVAALEVEGCWGSDADEWAIRDAYRVCAKAVTSTVEPGKPCFATIECLGGACDQTATCPGVCVAWKQPGARCNTEEACGPSGLCVNGVCEPIVGEGETCGAHRWCASGTFCAGGRCTSHAFPLGSTCTQHAQCGNGAYCSFAAIGATTGTCTAQRHEGDACNLGGGSDTIATAQCEGREVCVGLQVSTTTWRVMREGRCQPPSDVGGPCSADASNVSGAFGCYVGLVCDPHTNKCVVGPPAGEPCLTGACGPNAVCDQGGLCVDLPTVGEACVRGFCHPANYCDAGTCRLLKAEGAPCTSTAQCAGYCVNGKCAFTPESLMCHP